ncbi:Tetratricopeptide repeat protein [Desulfarculales bacterium]
MYRSLRVLALLLLAICWLAAPLPARAESVDLGVITVKDKTLAESIRQKLLKGESFEALARANSVGPTAQRGGRLGIVSEERLRNEYRQAAKKLKPGQPSAVIPTEDGYNLLMRFDQAPEAAAPKASAAGAPMARPGPAADSPQLAARLEVMAGLEKMTAGTMKASEAHFSKALGFNPCEDSATFLLEVARGALAGQVRPEAAKAFGEGFLRMFNGQNQEAVANFRKAKQLDPKLWQATLFEANLIAGGGKTAAATALLQQLLKENPNLARPHLTLGLIYQDQQQLDQAADEFKKALAVAPELAEAHYSLGNLALGRGQMEEAERELKAAVAADPYKEEAINGLGLVFGFTGRSQDAEKAYKKALELNPDYAAAHVNLGNLYGSGGRLNQAIDEFVKALNLTPNLAAAHNGLATAYAMKEEWPTAIRHADMAVKLGLPVADVLMQKLAPYRK